MRQVAVAILVLSAFLSLTNAFALQGVTVNGNVMTATVTTTDAALIGLSPGDPLNPDSSITGNAAGTAYVSGTGLVLDFRKGRGGATTFGLTASSPSSSFSNTFTFKKLFKITNNSDAERCISVFVPSGGPVALAEIQLGGTVVAGANGARSTCLPMAKGAAAWVDFKWIVTGTSDLLNQGFQVRVEGKTCSTGPC